MYTIKDELALTKLGIIMSGQMKGYVNSKLRNFKVD